MNVDIGDHVKSGEPLAVLEIPELKNDVQRVEADLLASKQEVHKAEANYEDTHQAYSRLVGVAKENAKLVAEQDLETAKTKDEAMKSGLESNRNRVVASQAEVDKMHAMLDYATITAPFAGVITKRYADTGSLIQAGISSDTQAMPVVDLAEDDRLRLVFPVPESAVGKIRVGKAVEISVDSMSEVFKGVIVRYAGKVDTSTRTMRAEVDIPNEGGKFTPGMYASVRLILDGRTGALCVPLQALTTGLHPTVMVLNSAREIEERQVNVGLQTSTKAEITSGLHEGDLVIIGNRSALHPGQKANGKITNLAQS
jgi:RND family efflux transporter MFP subunit